MKDTARRWAGFSDLTTKGGMPDVRRSLLDFMGKRELAANLFRLSETEERLKMSLARGQRPAEKSRVAR